MTRRGFALALALLGVVMLEALAAMLLVASEARRRLVSDARQAIEGELVVSSALADLRVGAAADLRSLADGERRTLAAPARSGWTVTAWAARRGGVIQLEVRAERRPAGGGVPFAARSGTLLMVVVDADTVRVTGRRGRF